MDLASQMYMDSVGPQMEEVKRASTNSGQDKSGMAFTVVHFPK